jgi:hypothetical protein
MIATIKASPGPFVMPFMVALMIFAIVAHAYGQVSPSDTTRSAVNCWDMESYSSTDPAPGAPGGVLPSGRPYKWLCSPNADGRWHRLEQVSGQNWIIADATDDTYCENHPPNLRAPEPAPEMWHLLKPDGMGNWCAYSLQQDWPTTQH